MILVESKSPNSSFHAAGKIMGEVLVSTTASQTKVFETSRTFSSFTETIIGFRYGFFTAVEKS